MIQSYKNLLDMVSTVELKLEQDKKALNKIKNILYQNKNLIIDKLIIFLQKELNINYYKYTVLDFDGNVADLLVKTDSNIFKDYIENKELLNFNVEELIDIRMFDNFDEIIITDLNSNDDFINLGYICESLSYNFLSYSDNIKNTLSTFTDYVINKNIYNNTKA